MGRLGFARGGHWAMARCQLWDGPRRSNTSSRDVHKNRSNFLVGVGGGGGGGVGLSVTQ